MTMVGVSDPLVRYRIVVGSMSSNPQRMINERLAVLYKHIGPEPSPTTQMTEYVVPMLRLISVQ